VGFSGNKLPVISRPKAFVLPIARSVTPAENSKDTKKLDLTKTERLREIHLRNWNWWKIFIFWETENKDLEWTGNKDRLQIKEWDH